MRGSCLLVMVTTAPLVLAGAGPPAAAQVVEIAVEFPVLNTNAESGVRCGSDGGPYRVRGHLAGPRAALEGPGPRVVTFYQYGFDTGEFNWRFREAPGHDWPLEMARLGHVSLSIDMVGYDASGHPEGDASCLGSQAEVAHQIVSMLRAGTYPVEAGALPIAFDQVVLAAHDVGGAVAEIQAYSWKQVAGLIVMGYADQGLTPYALDLAVKARGVCSEGGEPAEPGAPGGYHFFGPPDAGFRDQLFFDADDAVIDGVLALRNRNPCGYLGSILQSMAVAQLRLAEIEVPVLLLYSDQDPVFTREGREAQELHFVSSPSVTTHFQLDSGHFPMWERNAYEYRELVSDWLCDHGLVSAGAIACTEEVERVTGNGQVPGAGASEEEDERASLHFSVRFGSPPHGVLRYDDGERSIRAEAFEELRVNGSRAEFVALGQVDGAPARIRVVLEDRGDPGPGHDRFEIQVEEPGGYTNGPHPLRSGSLKIRR